jgi:hypothetical protein
MRAHAGLCLAGNRREVQVQRFDWRTVSCDDVEIGGVQPLMHGHAAHGSGMIFEKLGRRSEERLGVVAPERGYLECGMRWQDNIGLRETVAEIVNTVLEL